MRNPIHDQPFGWWPPGVRLLLVYQRPALTPTLVWCMVTVTIDPVNGIGGPVRILTDRVFLFDFGGFIGELVFDLAESGAATR